MQHWVGDSALTSEPLVWGQQERVAQIGSAFPLPSDLRSLCSGFVPIRSDFLTCSDFSEQIRETPFCRPLLNSQSLSVQSMLQPPGVMDVTDVRAQIRERKLNPNFFFSNFSGISGISRQNPGISRQKSLVSLVSRGIPNFLAPTLSRGRPPSHQKISGHKSLGLGSFFVPDKCLFSQGLEALPKVIDPGRLHK